ncbi:DNA-binding NarL/FixJ family response regulator [Inquilinus ginsengisoli]|uniref:DNA-binding NarL/FixJ family response regulator n=1 Tax=Inquilinus ginsengisoli TaxID=363840 RepID=A0ABU1JSI7_9PROT|nr:response regulator transcription factor [Inquilinus ginsengisoli]MDR6291591.1 DNA-binding NarL/FixJ family response regulator [Inquilinus ginsengisoli]
MTDATVVLIADDHPMVRRALAETLAEVMPVPVRVIEVGSFAEIAPVLERQAVDLMLLDLSMPGMNGYGGLASLRASFPTVPVVMVSANEDPGVIRQAMEFGASGYLPKSTPLAGIGEAIETVLGGGLWFPDALDAPPSPGELSRRVAEFTPQQLRVVLLLAEGKLSKQIAFEMSITEATVKAHLSHVFRKLGVQSRTQAVIAIRQLGLFGPLPD